MPRFFLNPLPADNLVAPWATFHSKHGGWESGWHVTKVTDQETGTWHEPSPTWLWGWTEGQPGSDGGRHRGRGDRNEEGGARRLMNGRDLRPERHRGPTAEWVRFLSDCSLLQSDEEKGQCLALQPWLSNHSWHLNMWTGRLTPQQTSAQRLQPLNENLPHPRSNSQQLRRDNEK